MWSAFNRVRNEARRVAGLHQMVFLIEDWRTFVLLSLWSDERAFLEFGTNIGTHLPAVRMALGSARRDRRAEVWSTEWKLRAISHNINWGDFREWSGLVHGSVHEGQKGRA
jgi:hypothetical protein